MHATCCAYEYHLLVPPLLRVMSHGTHVNESWYTIMNESQRTCIIPLVLQEEREREREKEREIERERTRGRESERERERKRERERERENERAREKERARESIGGWVLVGGCDCMNESWHT